VLAIEILAACQAIDLGAQAGRPGAEGLSPPTAAAYALVRSAVPPLGPDRVMYPDIEAVRALVADGSLIRAAWNHLGSPAEVD